MAEDFQRMFFSTQYTSPYQGPFISTGTSLIITDPDKPINSNPDPMLSPRAEDSDIESQKPFAADKLKITSFDVNSNSNNNVNAKQPVRAAVRKGVSKRSGASQKEKNKPSGNPKSQAQSSPFISPVLKPSSPQPLPLSPLSTSSSTQGTSRPSPFTPSTPSHFTSNNKDFNSMYSPPITPLSLPPSHPLPPPDQLFLKRGDIVGRGSFGTVFRCLDLKSGKLLADKELVFDSSTLSQQIQAAEKEIKIMQDLNHPNIVRYLGCQRSGTNLDVFQEFITGGSISRLLQTFSVFPEPLTRDYTRQILQGLAYLHEHRIVHRDIKGANCLVTGEGVVKLGDFGCSKSIETVMSLNQGAGTLCGTPHFMAPEVIRQQKNVGRRSDIWSLGCTVIEMLTGFPPYWDIKNQTAVIFKIASSNEIPPLPPASPECHDFLRRCFVRDPVKRATAKELLNHVFMKMEFSDDLYMLDD